MSLETILAHAIAKAHNQRRGKALIVGICGAQGSGKSTVAAALAKRIPHTVILSLDDLYLTLAEREQLAKDVHPMFRTRGVPGTHDVELGISVLDAIRSGAPTSLPRFAKQIDDRLPESAWSSVPADTRLVIFEGWCVGAMPQPERALIEPVNALERERDPDGIWRRHVNMALAGPYQRLFSHIDLLVMMAAPGWDIVPLWRREQETQLRASSGNDSGVMDDRQLLDFVSHYERLTRHILSEMPDRADIHIPLDGKRNPI